MTYYEQLTDPRWDKFCLDLIQSRGWKCCQCAEKTRKLQVHHGAYLKSVMLWDYPPEMLHVLCKKCHKRITESTQIFMRWFGSLNPFEVDEISISLPQLYEENKRPSGFSNLCAILAMIMTDCESADEDVGDSIIAKINRSIRADKEWVGYYRKKGENPK